SETISRLLRRRNVSHNVLNARQHQREAEIITAAGEPGSVTIATNMAGRGTDIKLGAGVVTQTTENYRGINSAVTEGFPYGQPQDGLHVIGSERHESRRIDRQLRGRAGRQGDPGTSRFYLSLEDDLMRIFGGDRIAPMMMKMGIKSGDAIRHPWMTKTVERAQKKVEEHNFEIRKNLIKYDEVMNQQREVIYSYRRSVLKGYSLKREVQEMVDEVVLRAVNEHLPPNSYPEDWDLERLCLWFRNNFNVAIHPEDLASDHLNQGMLESILQELVMQAYEKKEAQVGEEMMRDIERRSMLEVVDDEWRDHLHEMDLLKESVHLRSYAQKDPLVEYKRESFDLFNNLISRIQENVARKVFTTYILSKEQMDSLLNNAKTQHEDMSAFIQDQTLQVSQQNASEPPQFSGPYEGGGKPRPVHVAAKVGRNDPCPCGSGKKYKNCCGRFADTE
ncbi:MAG: SEC-C domain-containing protein, partial [Candidatus Cloacimonetes bacterium]|nr:SEC-C domain-containing protein [Candidatus Cloacimonadota bacterium]